ncbi:MAG: HAD family phosphatase [Candidatus Micrarchaeia archaeon]
MIKALIFDLDGVIADTEPLHYASFHEVLRRWGIRISWREWSTRYIGTGSSHILTDIFRRHGISEDVTKWVKRRSEIYARMLREKRVRPIRGFMRFYARARRAGLPCAVVSGGHRAHVRTTLRKLGIEEAFAIVSIEDVKNRKPHPEGFLVAAERLRVKPSACIAFEDSVAGVEAAERAGMTTIALTTSTTRKNLRKADLVVGDYTDPRLRKFLEKLSSASFLSG